MTTTERLPLTILLASPRGFCAGVDRAIAIVREALAKNGPPIYVRHEIVHNRHVVDELRAKGAVFVDELDEVPDDGIVVFSAHGVPKRVPDEAKRRQLIFADATCPLVSKVHREVERHAGAGRTVLLIGHAGHPEVEGTMGQVRDGHVLLVETVADAETVTVADPENVAYATQTTLSVTDTAAIVAALKERFPAIDGPRSEDICYATTNRQQAVAALAPGADLVLVVGAPNSSNSLRLVEVALNNGSPTGRADPDRSRYRLASHGRRRHGRAHRRRLGARDPGRPGDRCVQGALRRDPRDGEPYRGERLFPRAADSRVAGWSPPPEQRAIGQHRRLKPARDRSMTCRHKALWLTCPTMVTDGGIHLGSR